MIFNTIFAKVNSDTFKYQKRNWLKIKCNLYEFADVYAGGNFQNIVFFKGKDFIHFGTPISKSKELQKFKLGTSIVVWFKCTSRAYNGKWYSNNSLMHFEKYVPKLKQMQDEHDYAMSIHNQQVTNKTK